MENKQAVGPRLEAIFQLLQGTLMQLRIKKVLFSILNKKDGVSDLLFWVVSGFSPPKCNIWG